MALATLGDLAAIGALPASPENHPDASRAMRLIEMASAQVATYLATTEATIATWAEEHQTVVATVVAEAAGRRLTSPAAFTADQLQDGTGLYSSALLSSSHRRTLDELPKPSSRGTGSLTLTTADYTSVVSWAQPSEDVWT